MNPLYVITRYPLGWVLSAAPKVPGVPFDAFTEVLPLLPKGAVMDAGIAAHLRRMADGFGCFHVMAAPADARQWRDEITRSLAHLPPERRWWLGVDTGLSSQAIFAVLALSRLLAEEAGREAQGRTPMDADDFGRCLRLVQAMPGWRDRLPEVAKAYPDTKWPQIVARWDEIAAADAAGQTSILRSL